MKLHSCHLTGERRIDAIWLCRCPLSWTRGIVYQPQMWLAVGFRTPTRFPWPVVRLRRWQYLHWPYYLGELLR